MKQRLTQVDDIIAPGTPGLYINGEWCHPAQARAVPVVNPATGKAIGDIEVGSAQDVERAVSAARAAFKTWSTTPGAERAAVLDRMFNLMNERAEMLAQAISLEMGAAIEFARKSQVPLAIDHIRVARDLAQSYVFTKVDGHTAIAREPIGVCGLITPWNWPLYQITAKVGPAMAAGCTVILKPSELSPLNAYLFAQIVHDAGVPPGVFNLIQGGGAEVGHALSSHDGIDMISITGSNRAGALVAQAAAVSVKRVTQELGGKSPNVLLPDADLEKCVPLSVMSALRNVGQSCSAPTRMIVPREHLAEIEAIAKKTVETIVIGDPFVESTTMGPIANEAQFGRVQALIDAGISEGATLICGGPGKVSGMESGFYARPTIFSNVKTSMRIAQEEIFGPVLSILPYDTLAEAVDIANDTVYGLGAQVQSRDLAAARVVASQIRAGQVHINFPDRDPMAPFGGYKRSGNGREYGVHGFEEYLETKAILGYN